MAGGRRAEGETTKLTIMDYEKELDELAEFLHDMEVSAKLDWHLYVSMSWTSGSLENTWLTIGVCQDEEGHELYSLYDYTFENDHVDNESLLIPRIITMLSPIFDDAEKMMWELVTKFRDSLVWGETCMPRALHKTYEKVIRKLPMEKKDAFPTKLKKYINDVEAKVAKKRDLVSDREFMTNFYFKVKEIKAIDHISTVYSAVNRRRY